MLWVRGAFLPTIRVPAVPRFCPPPLWRHVAMPSPGRVASSPKKSGLMSKFVQSYEEFFKVCALPIRQKSRAHSCPGWSLFPTNYPERGGAPPASCLLACMCIAHTRFFSTCLDDLTPRLPHESTLYHNLTRTHTQNPNPASFDESFWNDLFLLKVGLITHTHTSSIPHAASVHFHPSSCFSSPTPPFSRQCFSDGSWYMPGAAWSGSHQ